MPGVNSLTAHTLLSEVGPDLPNFPHAAALASGLGRCPDNRISGGPILSGRTRQVVNRLAVALRLAAPSLHRRQLVATVSAPLTGGFPPTIKPEFES